MRRREAYLLCGIFLLGVLGGFGGGIVSFFLLGFLKISNENNIAPSEMMKPQELLKELESHLTSSPVYDDFSIVCYDPENFSRQIENIKKKTNKLDDKILISENPREFFLLESQTDTLDSTIFSSKNPQKFNPTPNKKMLTKEELRLQDDLTTACEQGNAKKLRDTKQKQIEIQKLYTVGQQPKKEKESSPTLQTFTPIIVSQNPYILAPSPKNFSTVEQFQLQNQLIAACKRGDNIAVITWLEKEAQPNLLSERGEHPLGAAVWGMNPEVVNTLLKQLGDLSPITWAECEAHNQKYYKEIFIVEKFASTLVEWGQLLQKIDSNPFIRDYHVQKTNMSSWEDLQKFVEFTICLHERGKFLPYDHYYTKILRWVEETSDGVSGGVKAHINGEQLNRRTTRG